MKTNTVTTITDKLPLLFFRKKVIEIAYTVNFAACICRLGSGVSRPVALVTDLSLSSIDLLFVLGSPRTTSRAQERSVSYRVMALW